MRRFLLPRPFADGETFAAEGDDFHYLARVLRLREGTALPAGDAAGASYLLALEKRERAKLIFRVRREGSGQVAPDALRIVLLICLPKPAKMDLIVRMTTEAGVDRIEPVTSDYSAVAEREAGRLAERRRRWEKIARAAYEQCGRPSLPSVGEIARLADAEPASPGEIAFFADERGGASLHEIVGAGACARARIVIGPEGGLSDAERAALAAKGFAPAYLGKNVLRTETAAVVACAAVRLLVAEKVSWKPI
ncbi:MAG: 16S rRNA (uracil(1498)-N(3))-methyltransferase [Spirochaetales bacterium]|nr:16S rRNA (uracil(1498)-N(3))-methyltransferase [Spirochaetales bacterium]